MYKRQLLLRAGALGLNTSVSAWGYQIELGAFATSHIPTAASSVTRSADSAVMTGTNFSSWYNQSEGTFIISGATYSPTTDTGDRYFFYAHNSGDVSNRIRVLRTLGTSANYDIASGGVVQASFVGGSLTTLPAKLAVGYRVNDFAFVDDGAILNTDSAGSVPVTITALAIGSAATLGTAVINGWIASLTYYRTRLPNDTLRRLTQ